MQAHILLVDEDSVCCQFFTNGLMAEGHYVTQVQTGEEALACLARQPYDLLATDVQLPDMSGLALTRAAHGAYPCLAIIVMTACGSLETAVEVIQEGALNYVSKPSQLAELKQMVALALDHRAHARDETKLERLPQERNPSRGLIGSSPAMIPVYKTVARVAPTKSTVLVAGESGTGKELIAHAIHQHSPRAHGPFVALDCGALAETLLESELFGHVRGAFTGAAVDKKGVFEEAQSGTCFLDEIGDISPAMQAKLLRVLQEGEVRRVGGQKWTKVDVRIIAATNKDLAELVRKKLFREDLYYRLKVVTLALPPLRERPEDIPLLAHHFVQRYCDENGKPRTTLSADALELLRSYAWPGNVRELEHTIERAVALADHAVLTAEDFSLEVTNEKIVEPSPLAHESPSVFADAPTLEELKKRYILHVLDATQRNLARTARVLAVDRRSLYRTLRRYKIELPPENTSAKALSC